MNGEDKMTLNRRQFLAAGAALGATAGAGVPTTLPASRAEPIG